MFYNYKGDTFKIKTETNCFKLYHKAQNKWSTGWTFIGQFKTKQLAENAAKKYSM